MHPAYARAEEEEEKKMESLPHSRETGTPRASSFSFFLSFIGNHHHRLYWIT
jgi:hypothetical protein